MKLRPGAAMFIITVAILVGYVVAPAPADAASFSIALNFEFSRATAPCGTAPWLTATFTDEGVPAGTVRLTMQGNLQCIGEKVKKWLFNLDPTLNPTQLSFSFVSGPVASAINTAVNGYQADGDGKFDVQFQFSTAGAGAFNDSMTSIYDITYGGAGTFGANSFNFLSAVGGGRGTFRSAAHVLGTGEDNEESGWIGDKNGDTPRERASEPGSLLLMGIGAAVAYGTTRRRA